MRDRVRRFRKATVTGSVEVDEVGDAKLFEKSPSCNLVIGLRTSNSELG